jgi:hypothetical protein
MQLVPEVSVVMSVFNDACYLRLAVEGILSQEGVELEFVIVDDGSTDSSVQILEQYATADPRINLIRQENAGLTQALRRGCEAARGEFIARQDSDDWSHPERLEKQVNALRRDPTLAFVSCWAEGITTEGRLLERVERPADPAEATRGLRFERQGPPAHGTVMFRRALYERVGGYRPQFYFSQDSDLWLRMAEQGRVQYLPEVLYRFRRDADSLSSVRHDVQYEFGEFGQACHAVRERGGDESELLEQAAELTRQIVSGTLDRREDTRRVAATQYLIGSQLAINGDRSALGYLWPVIRRQPWHWKAWVRMLQATVGAWQ